MTTWFTADLHLGHRNIIDHCDRPFPHVDAMNDALIERWNEAVAVDDTVWVVGDFALGKIADTLPLVAALHGRKVLVAGNHDRCWAGHCRRADGWTERYLDAGFEEIRQGSTRVDIGETTVVVCHFPYRGDGRGQDMNLRPSGYEGDGHRPRSRRSGALVLLRRSFQPSRRAAGRRPSAVGRCESR